MKTRINSQEWRSTAVLWTAALLCLQAAGCFRSLDASKLTCSKKEACPAGSYCSPDGKCVVGSSSNDGGKDVPISSLPEVGSAGGTNGDSGGDHDAPVDEPITPACESGQHLCGGKCVRNDDTSSCGAACSACPVPQNGTATCDGTSCGGSCPTGKTLCNGTCIAQGTSCSTDCPT